MSYSRSEEEANIKLKKKNETQQQAVAASTRKKSGCARLNRNTKMQWQLSQQQPQWACVWQLDIIYGVMYSLLSIKFLIFVQWTAHHDGFVVVVVPKNSLIFLSERHACTFFLLLVRLSVTFFVFHIEMEKFVNANIIIKCEQYSSELHLFLFHLLCFLCAYGCLLAC